LGMDILQSPIVLGKMISASKATGTGG